MRSQFMTTLTAGLLAIGSAAIAAAPPSKPQAEGHNVAVIDVNEIFTNHLRFKAMVADMKGDVAQAEQRVKAEQEEIKKMAEGLKDLLAGTRDYLDLQEKIRKQAEDLKTRVQLQKAEFLQREGQAYLAIYKEITREVAEYAAENGIEVVLRVYTGSDDPKNPQQVLQVINRQIVWFAEGRDITQVILDRLNKKGSGPKTPAQEPPKEKPPAEKPGGGEGDGKTDSRP